MVPLKLHTTDAYILLVPPPPKLADVARLLLATGELHSGQVRRPLSASDGP
jgi:hypothetical protein